MVLLGTFTYAKEPCFIRVYFSYDFFLPSGGTCNLAGIGASVLNFGRAWPADVCAAET